MMKHSRLALAVCSLLGMGAHAAALDRSGQDSTPILQDGTYAEVVYTYIDGKLTGKDTQGRATGDIAKKHDYFRYAVKADVSDNISVAVLYDEPFGASVAYGDNNAFYGTPSQSVAQVTGGLIAKSAAEKSADAAQSIKQVDALIAALPDGDEKEMVGTARILLESSQLGLDQLAKNPTLAGLNSFNQIAEPGTQALADGIQLLKDAGLYDSFQPSSKAFLEGFAARSKAAVAEAKKTAAVLEVINKSVASTTDAHTTVDVKTRNITGLVGVKAGGFTVFGGPVAQRLDADLALNGTAYAASTGYRGHIGGDNATGYAAGVAYSVPKIALRAALTYRSPIEHDAMMNETLPFAPLVGSPTTTRQSIKVKTPESFNLDFQTGINPTTLLTAKVRYVPWKKFSITPPTYHALTKRAVATGLPLVSYDKDGWSAELGLGKKISPKIAISGNIGYDSGAGNPTSTLGPINGNYSAGLGARVNLTDNWSVSAGGKYLWLGDAKAKVPTGNLVGEFKGNNGYAFGVKLSYQQK